MKLLSLSFMILLTACSMKWNENQPDASAGGAAQKFDVSLCPNFKPGYYDRTTNEKVYFNRQENSLIVRDRENEFVLDGAEHSLSEDSTYIGGCLRGYARVLIKSKSKNKDDKDTFVELFYARNGGRMERGMIVNGNRRDKRNQEAILFPLSDI